jgi:hypothetical protein
VLTRSTTLKKRTRAPLRMTARAMPAAMGVLPVPCASGLEPVAPHRRAFHKQHPARRPPNGPRADHGPMPRWRGHLWTPITPKAGPLLRADQHGSADRLRAALGRGTRCAYQPLRAVGLRRPALRQWREAPCSRPRSLRCCARG